MWVLGTKLGNPTAALLLSQVPNSPVCNYNVGDGGVPLLSVCYHLEVMKFPSVWSLQLGMIEIPL